MVKPKHAANHVTQLLRTALCCSGLIQEVATCGTAFRAITHLVALPLQVQKKSSSEQELATLVQRTRNSGGGIFDCQLFVVPKCLMHCSLEAPRIRIDRSR